VPCVAGMNAGTVSMTASDGAESALRQPTTSPSMASQTVPLQVAENQLIEAVATRGAMSNEYWVRCLPHDFPVMRWVPHPKAGTPTPGYYLVGNPYPIPNLGVGWAIVLDSHGVPVWYYKETGEGVFDMDSLAPGTISFLASAPEPNRMSLPWELRQLSSPMVTHIGPGGTDTDSHELQFVAKTGHHLLYTIVIEEGFDLSGLTVELETGATRPLGTNENIASSKLLEIDAAGKTVWSWDVTEHFDPNTASTYPRTGENQWHAANNTRPVYDVFHLNSIDVDLDSGGLPRGLLLSGRNMDAVFYVEYPSGKVLWKMGGTTSSKDSGVTYLPPPSQPFFRQHDARLLPGWSPTTCGGHGQLSVFDDETEMKDALARGVLYDVTVRSDGSSTCANPGATVSWQYRGQANSLFMGSFRVQSDGSSVIGWGTPASLSGPVFTEVDVGRNDLLDLYFMPGFSYRAIKVPVGALDIEQMRKTAGVHVQGG
jgi:hypothetical protein